MAYDIGTARGVIEMKYNGRGVAQAQVELSGLEKAAGRAQKIGVASLGAIGLGGYGLAKALQFVVGTGADFEHQMSAIQAVSGATGDELDALRNKALQLGADTAFTSSEAAAAMEELVKAGLSVEEVLNGAADAAVALAAAGGISIPEAATIAANSLNAFALQAEDLAGVVDVISGAANASAIDVGDLGQSLKQVGAVAHVAGLSFEDTATAIALLGNAGIVGSDAGTSLKTMLQNLQPTTTRQIKLFKQLGIVTEEGNNRFFDAQGNVKDYASIAGVLARALEGQTNQQKLLNLETLFGTDAIRAAAITAEQGRKGIKGLNEEMNKTTAADVAAARMDNLKGSFDQLGGSIEAAIIKGGSSSLVVLRDIVDWLTNAVNEGTDLAGAFSDEVAPAFEDTVDIIGDLLSIGWSVIDLFDGIIVAGAAIGGSAIIGGLTDLLGVVADVTGFLEENKEVAAALGITYLIVANGGVAALTASLVALYRKGIGNALAGLFSLNVGAGATRASLTALMGTVQAVMAAFAAVLVITSAINAWQAYKQAVQETEDALKSAKVAAKSGSVDAIGSEIQSLSKMIDERKKIIKDYAVQNQDISGMLELQFVPWKWDDALKAEEYDNTIGEMEAANQDLINSMVDVGGGIAYTAHVLDLIDADQFNELMDGIRDGDPKSLQEINDLMTKIQPLLEEAGISADAFQTALEEGDTQKVNEIAAALSNVEGNAGLAEGATESLAQAAENFGNEAETAADKADKLKDALDRLIGVEVDAIDAGIKWREALRELQAQLKDNNGSLKLGTKEGDANVSKVNELTDATLDQLEAEAKSGASLKRLTNLFGDSRQAMIDAAEAAHGNGEEMADLLDKINFTPKAVRVLFEQVGIEKAQTELDALKEKADGLTEKDFELIFKDAGADSVAEKVRALKRFLREAKVGVDDLQGGINGMRGRDVEISMPGMPKNISDVDRLKQGIDNLHNKDVWITTYMRALKAPPGKGPGSQEPGSTDELFGAPGDGKLLAGMTPTGLPSPVPGLPPKGTGGSGGKRGKSLRLMEGTLRIDESGTAFISGIAEEVDDDDDDYSDTLRRMN